MFTGTRNILKLLITVFSFAGDHKCVKKLKRFEILCSSIKFVLWVSRLTFYCFVESCEVFVFQFHFAGWIFMVRKICCVTMCTMMETKTDFFMHRKLGNLKLQWIGPGVGRLTLEKVSSSSACMNSNSGFKFCNLNSCVASRSLMNDGEITW